jgi:hypothetical protein
VQPFAIPPEKRGRRHKDAPRTPATGYGERALADAPIGARLQGTTSPNKTSQFSRKQRLDALARQFKLSPSPRGNGLAIILRDQFMASKEAELGAHHDPEEINPVRLANDSATRHLEE